MKKELEIIETTISKGSQSLEYKQLINYKGYKLRINIKSDSYEPQSYARISILKDLKWEILDYIPSSQMSTNSELVYQPRYRQNYDMAEKEFLKDSDLLVKNAIELLS